MTSGETLVRRASASSLAPVYLVLGDNDWLKARLVARLRDLAVPEEWRSMNVESLWADETPEAEVADAARMAPFGSAHRCLVVHGVEAYLAAPAGEEGGKAKRRPRKKRAGPGAPLAEYARDPSSSTVLVLCCRRWDARKWDGEPLREAVEGSGEVVACERPTGPAVRDWILEHARESGLRLEPAAAAEMAERIGNDPLVLHQETEKLACYVGGARPATAADVAELTGQTATPSIFRFLDVLFVERRPHRAVQLLGQLLQESHPLRLHALLQTQLRKLVLLKGAFAEGLAAGPAAGRVKLPMSVISQVSMMVRRTPSARFAELLRALAAAETALKRGQPGREVMERLVFECCREEGIRRRTFS